MDSRNYGLMFDGCVSSEHQRQQHVRDEHSADEEADHRHEGRKLEVGEAADGMPGRTATGIAGAKSDQEPAADDHHDTGQREQPAPADDLRRDEPGKVAYPEDAKSLRGIRGKRDGAGSASQKSGGQEATEGDAREEREIPEPRPFPVIAEEVELRRERGGAHVAQIGRDAELLSANKQKQRHNEPDDGPRDVPGPGLKKRLSHSEG